MTRSTEIIVNRNAKHLRGGALLGRIAAAVRDRARLRETHSLSELAQAAAEIARAAPERVVLCGGDGTFMAGLSALYGAFGGAPLPEIGLVPAGTVATVARNWGARSPLPALERALAAEARTTSRATLRIEENGGESVRLGFTFGTGLVAHFFEAYDRAPGRGSLVAAAIAARVFAGSFLATPYARHVLRPIACELRAEGRKLPGAAYSLVVCSVIRDLGLHLLVTYRADSDPNRIHVVASTSSPAELGRQALRVIRGQPMSGPGVVDELTAELRLVFTGTVAGPYVLDGDTFSARELRICPGPRIRVVT